MPSLPDRSEYTRAFRDGEKAERRQLIIDSAEAVLREIGFDKFAIDRVVEKSGFSRGGIYKYFRTKEDLLLTVHMKQVAAWGDRLLSKIKPGMTDEAFLTAFLDASLADPLYLRVVRRFESMANENTSEDVIALWQNTFEEHAHRCFNHLADCLDLDYRSAADAVWSLSALLMGVSIQRNPRSLSHLDISGSIEKRARIELKQRFLKYAQTIMRGLRSG